MIKHLFTRVSVFFKARLLHAVSARVSEPDLRNPPTVIRAGTRMRRTFGWKRCSARRLRVATAVSPKIPAYRRVSRLGGDTLVAMAAPTPLERVIVAAAVRARPPEKAVACARPVSVSMARGSRYRQTTSSFFLRHSTQETVNSVGLLLASILRGDFCQSPTERV